MKHYGEKLFIQEYPLSRKKPIKKTVAGLFATSLTLLLITIVMVGVLAEKSIFSSSFFQNLPLVIISLLLILLVGIILITYLYELWYYRTYFYNFTEDLIIIRKGPIAPQEITIPYHRVQDVYVDQDIFDRVFGLYDVHISTATAISGARAHIDGVEKEVAEKLRELILRKIHQTKVSIPK